MSWESTSDEAASELALVVDVGDGGRWGVW